MAFDLFGRACELAVGCAQTESIARLYDDALLLVNQLLQLLPHKTPNAAAALPFKWTNQNWRLEQ